MYLLDMLGAQTLCAVMCFIFTLIPRKAGSNKKTSLPKVIWEEGRVAALSHTYAVKFLLVTMAHPKFAPKVPLPVDRSQTPLPASSLDPFDLWCQAASGSDPPIFHNALDRQTHARTYVYVRTDRSSTGKCDEEAAALRERRGLKHRKQGNSNLTVLIPPVIMVKIALLFRVRSQC